MEFPGSKALGLVGSGQGCQAQKLMSRGCTWPSQGNVNAAVLSWTLWTRRQVSLHPLELPSGIRETLPFEVTHGRARQACAFHRQFESLCLLVLSSCTPQQASLHTGSGTRQVLQPLPGMGRESVAWLADLSRSPGFMEHSRVLRVHPGKSQFPEENGVSEKVSDWSWS